MPYNASDLRDIVKKLKTIEQMKEIATVISKPAEGVAEASPMFAKLWPKREAWTDGGEKIEWPIVTTEKEAEMKTYQEPVGGVEEEFLQPAILNQFRMHNEAMWFIGQLYKQINNKLGFANYVQTKYDRCIKGFGQLFDNQMFNLTADTSEVLPGTDALGRQMSTNHLVGLGTALESYDQIAGSAPSGWYAGFTRSATTPYFNNNAINVSGGLAGLNKGHLRAAIAVATHEGLGSPDLAVLDDSQFTKVKSIIETEIRADLPADSFFSGLGYNSFVWSGVSWVASKRITVATLGGKLTTARTRFELLNTQHMKLKVVPQEAMQWRDLIPMTNQDSIRRDMYLTGCFLVSNPRCHTVIYGLTV